MTAAGNVLELLERHVEAVGDRETTPRRDQRVAAREPLALDARERDCDALARFGPLDRAVVHLHAAHAHVETPRGSTRSSSPSPIVPDQSVPVTTVPIPRSVKTRST